MNTNGHILDIKTNATFSLDQVQEALEKSEKRIFTRAVIIPNP